MSDEHVVVPYTAWSETPVPTSDELRARIPGWGVDLDPADRPAVRRELGDGNVSDLPAPVQQPDLLGRERSIEHAHLTPVFGTSCPPKGVSGAIRKLAYARYSEARAAHWLLLIGADRVDALEHHLRSLVTRRPDNPITQTGVLTERRRHGLSSRLGRRRADVWHHPIDAVIVAGPWVIGAAVASRVVGRLRRAGQPSIVRSRRAPLPGRC
jgi:hypothetical protein